jgi:hypothetical protein
MSLLDRAILVVYFLLAAVHVIPITALTLCILSVALLVTPLIQKT